MRSLTRPQLLRSPTTQICDRPPREESHVTGPAGQTDARRRCGWAGSTPDYIDYHDNEWGRPVRDDKGLFERLTLEAFQSGLSWLTILRKRENFRTAFAGFEIAAVAAFTADDRARLLADAGIVRNRAKIDAAISNARAALDVEAGLAELIWSFAPEAGPAPATLADIPAQTAESQALSKELKRRGFVFVGPVTAYALMQATGIVDDHVKDCWVREGV
ncbi:MAG: DNA-3-methyladenine glycosylase I [Nocardioidaceae bacterium]|nr:DNA-3-methyladenine glycosylase I [Nocardioidaceae bacterium]